MGKRRLIGPVDTIWLNMDRPNNLMVIDSLVFLDGPADWDRIVDVVRTRMVERYPVFRQRPVMPIGGLGRPHWQDDADFDLARHVVRARLESGDDAALQGYVAQHTGVPLDRRHPLWQVHLLDGYDGGAVVFSRLHHGLADGIALARVLLDLTDDSPDGGAPPDLAAPAPPGRDDMGIVEGAFRVATAAGSAAGAALGSTTAAVRSFTLGAARALDPHVVAEALLQAGRTGAMANKLLLGPHPDLPLSRTPGVSKQVTWCRPFPLSEVSAAAHRFDATVNDVMVASLAGSLAAYTIEQGGTPTDVATMVPVNVRRLDRPLPKHLGNQFALVLLRLPLGVPDRAERVAETKRRMDAIKHSVEVPVTFAMIKTIGRTGPTVERHLVDFFADKAIGVTTNVPGPTEPRYLAGRRITRVISWPPESGEQTLGVSIFSYAREVHVGFRADRGAVPDPGRLVDAFEAEVTALTEALLPV